jgi:diacylglycerol kinase family enzyme
MLITQHAEMPLVSPGSRASRKVLIFANPIAGRGRSLRTATEISGVLSGAGYEPVLILTPPESSDLPPGPHHAAVSIGGDGTLRAVVSRLCSPSPRTLVPLTGPLTAPPPVLVVAMGTANLMRQSLGLPVYSPGSVLEIIRNYRVVPRDAALANGELFLIVAGAGLDGQVIHDLSAHRTGPISYLSYVLPTVRSVMGWRYPEITVEVDGERVFGPARGMAMVGHVREHGIGFSFLSQADPTDRRLDVVAFTCASFRDGLDRLLATTAGHLAETPGAVYARARHRVTMTSPEPVAVQVDGEPAGHTPLVVEMYPRAIPFLAG